MRLRGMRIRMQLQMQRTKNYDFEPRPECSQIEWRKSTMEIGNELTQPKVHSNLKREKEKNQLWISDAACTIYMRSDWFSNWANSSIPNMCVQLSVLYQGINLCRFIEKFVRLWHFIHTAPACGMLYERTNERQTKTKIAICNNDNGGSNEQPVML